VGEDFRIDSRVDDVVGGVSKSAAELWKELSMRRIWRQAAMKLLPAGVTQSLKGRLFCEICLVDVFFSP
jgi:hypothetical protein